MGQEDLDKRRLPQKQPAPQEKPRNAFSELMSHRSPQKPEASTEKLPTFRNKSSRSNPQKRSRSPRPDRKPLDPSAFPHLPKDQILTENECRQLNAKYSRNALVAYTTHPANFAPGRVLYYNDDFVAIRDVFPKASIHVLLLPRDPKRCCMDPFEALNGEGQDNQKFLNDVKMEACRLKGLAASELRRAYSHCSAQERTRNSSLESMNEPDNTYSPTEEPSQLPPGRNWSESIKVGIHAGPSMNHLHIHIISTEMQSSWMKHRKHYNSFQTPFFIPLEDFPLSKNDERRHPGEMGFLDRNLVCWRCGRDFGNRFAELKRHLQDEFDSWRRE